MRIIDSSDLDVRENARGSSSCDLCGAVRFLIVDALLTNGDGSAVVYGEVTGFPAPGEWLGCYVVCALCGYGMRS